MSRVFYNYLAAGMPVVESTTDANLLLQAAL